MIELREVENEFFLGAECRDCPWLETCGGLKSENALLTCTSLCCQDKERCTLACPQNPLMLEKRLIEVSGFSLGNIPPLPQASFASPPRYVPFVKSGELLKAQALVSDWIAIPMYALVNGVSALPKFRNRSELNAKFNLRPSTQLIISGDGPDRRIELLWKFWGKKAFTDNLRTLRPAIVTTPDYSMYRNVPRTSNLHSMKRIAWYWFFLAKENVPTALHVNSRAAGDWERWVKFLQEHKEIETISYEFGSGTGDPSRRAIHLEHLCTLQESVGRPLTVFVKGGKRMLRELTSCFSVVCVLDTDPYIKTVHNQKAYLNQAPELGWETLESDSTIGRKDLFTHNVEMCRFVVTGQPLQQSFELKPTS